MLKESVVSVCRVLSGYSSSSVHEMVARALLVKLEDMLCTDSSKPLLLQKRTHARASVLLCVCSLALVWGNQLPALQSVSQSVHPQRISHPPPEKLKDRSEGPRGAHGGPPESVHHGGPVYSLPSPPKYTQQQRREDALFPSPYKRTGRVKSPSLQHVFVFTFYCFLVVVSSSHIHECPPTHCQEVGGG